ncbi:MAG: hypothetical protein WC947_04595 [Elusimicrobiota bacterium]
MSKISYSMIVLTFISISLVFSEQKEVSKEILRQQDRDEILRKMPKPKYKRVEYTKIESEIKNIKENKTFTKDEFASNELIKLCQKLDDKFEKEYDLKFMYGKPFDYDEMMELNFFIDKYPNTSSALTAKVRIGMLFLEHNDAKNREKSNILSRKIFEGIIKTNPSTWQAILSKWYISIVMMNEWKIDNKINKINTVNLTTEQEQKLLSYLIKNKEQLLYLDGEKDTEWEQLKKRVLRFPDGSIKYFSALVYYNIAARERETGNLDEAEKIYNLIITHYKDDLKMVKKSKSSIEQLKYLRNKKR